MSASAAERAAAERAAQGLPPHLEDIDILEAAARMLAGALVTSDSGGLAPCSFNLMQRDGVDARCGDGCPPDKSPAGIRRGSGTLQQVAQQPSSQSSRQTSRVSLGRSC